MVKAFVLFFAVILLSFAVGTTIRVGLVYLAHDENRWHGFWGFFGEQLDNSWLRPLFTLLLGQRIARWTIAACVRRGDLRRAEAVALAEGLVDEAVHCMAALGKPLEAARLARRTGRDSAARKLYRTCIDHLVAEDRLVSAAEAADEAGFWQEAVRLHSGLENAGSRLRAATLCARNGEPERAVEILKDRCTRLDAMRVVRDGGDTDFVLSHCRHSRDPVLHHFAAETAWKEGRPELGIEILLEHGHLKSAAQLAHAAGLMDRAAELFDRVREDRIVKERQFRERVFGKIAPDRPDPFRPPSDTEEEDAGGGELHFESLDWKLPDHDPFERPRYVEVEGKDGVDSIDFE